MTGGRLVAPLDHREQQVGVGVALRRVQHVVHALHRGGDAHRADVRRAFVGPDGELHRLDHQPCAAHERAREQFGEVAGLLVALDRREHAVRSTTWSSCPRLRADWRGRGRRPTRSGRAARQRSSWRSTSWPSLSSVPAGSSVEFCGRGAGGAGRACRPRPAACRVRATGSARAASRAASRGRRRCACRRAAARCARAPLRARSRPGAVTRVEARRRRCRRRRRRRCSHARRAFGAERERAPAGAVAPRSSSARAVSAEERLRQQEARVRPDRRQVARRGAAAGSDRCRCRAASNRRAELVFDHVGQRADDQQRRRRVGALRPAAPAPATARQASSPCVKVVSMPLPE